MRKIISILILNLFFVSWVFADNNFQETKIKDEYTSFQSNNIWEEIQYIWYKDNKTYFIKDGIIGKVWYWFIHDIKHSSDWKNYAFKWGKTWDNSKQVVVINWLESKEYAYIKNLTCSKNLESCAFVANKNSNDWKYILVKDWVESEEYNYDIKKLKYSPDWVSFWYTITKWINDYEAYEVIIKDWVEIDDYESSNNLQYSKNGKDYYFVWKNNWKDVIVKNWIEIYKYDSISSIISSDNLDNFLFVAGKNWKYIVVNNWIESKEYKDIGNLIKSTDWSSYSFQTKKDWKNLIVKDWIESNLYDEISEDYKNYYWYLWDTNILLFSAKKDWKWVFSTDLNESKEYDWITNMIFSNKTESVSYVAYDRDDNENYTYYVIKDWKNIATYDFSWILNHWISSLIYSIDWKKITYKVRKGSFYTFNNWISGKKYRNIINMNFSDNWDLLYIVRNDEWKWMFVKNWIESNLYEEILPFSYYDENNKYKHKYHTDWAKSIFIWQTWINEKKELFLIDNFIEKNKYSSVKYLNYFDNTPHYVFVWKKSNNENDILIVDWIEFNQYENIWLITTIPNSKWFSFIWERDWNNYIVKYLFSDTKTKTNPKIDKVLNKFFVKVDKKWEIKANIAYKKIIVKIDSIISKSKSAKNKELLEYIKVKFEEKVQ